VGGRVNRRHSRSLPAGHVAMTSSGSGALGLAGWCEWRTACAIAQGEQPRPMASALGHVEPVLDGR
jgi:hypothetical protein